MERIRTALILVLTGAFLASCGDSGEEPKPVAEKRWKAAKSGDKDSGRPKRVPRAAIVVDGKAGDWAEVPVFLAPKSRRTSYQVQEIKLARDEDHLYVLFRLGVGIGERFQRDKKAGRLGGHAIGYLDLAVDAGRYSLWLPTGYAVAGPSAICSYDLMCPPRDHQIKPVLTKKCSEHPDWIAFHGKHLELKVPLNKLNATADSRFVLRLAEF